MVFRFYGVWCPALTKIIFSDTLQHSCKAPVLCINERFSDYRKKAAGILSKPAGAMGETFAEMEDFP